VVGGPGWGVPHPPVPNYNRLVERAYLPPAGCAKGTICAI
jgi:hypothetical protein